MTRVKMPIFGHSIKEMPDFSNSMFSVLHFLG